MRSQARTTEAELALRYAVCPRDVLGAKECKLMDLQRNARQTALIALAGDLAREHFAPRAARYDLEASFPFENYADLRRTGLLGLCIPESYGAWVLIMRPIA